MPADSPMNQLIERFAAWGQGRPDIRAIAILGSQARTDRPADEWSDLDLLIVAADPQHYLASGAWLAELGQVRLTFLEPTAVGGLVERRVLFDGALDADLTFVSPAVIQQLYERGLPDEVAGVFRRGVRLLVDKDGVAALFVAPAAEPPAPAGPPAESEFLEVVNDFLYHAVWVAKKARRGELWVAVSCCDAFMKRLLLRMIEWHAGALTGANTWHAGRFLEQWADPRAVEGLRQAFARYDAADLRRALLANLTLFRWLAIETAERLGYTYPLDAHDYVAAWVEGCLG